ncbi:hypothetical protein D3C76_1372840 [compost metagenome]
MPHVENTKSTQAIYKLLSLGVDKRIQTPRLPLYGSVIPACCYRFSVFQKPGIYMLFEVINHLAVKLFHLLMIKRSLLNEIQCVRGTGQGRRAGG